MVRRIVSEDTAQADASKRSHATPEAQIYLPNYKEVNHILMESPNKASVSFGEALSKSSIQMLETQENVYKSIERDSLIADVNSQYQMKLEEFDESNPSGRGYAEYATGTYSQLIEEASSKSQSPEVGQQIRALGQVNMKGIANSSVSQENKRFVAYHMSETQKGLEIKYNQIQNNPDRFEGLGAEATAIINSLEGVIPASKLNEIRGQARQNLFMSYGMGLVKNNPDQAVDFLRNDFFSSNLNNDNYNKLINFSERKKIEKEKHDHRLNIEMLMQQGKDSLLELKTLEIGIESNSIDLSDIENNTVLTPLHKQEAILRYNKKNEKELEYQNEALQINEIHTKGGDISTINHNSQQRYYNEIIAAKAAQLKGESEKTGNPTILTTVDKVIAMKDFSFTNKELKDQIVSDLIQDSDVGARRTAAFALQYGINTNPKMFGNVESKYVNFAHETTRYCSVDSKNSAKIMERASNKYLSGKSEDENKEIIKFRNKNFLDSASLNFKKFKKNISNSGIFSSNLQIENEDQLYTDYIHELDAVIAGGCRDLQDIMNITTDRIKGYWKESGSKIVRNPPSLSCPYLSEFALKNTIASKIKNSISALKGKNTNTGYTFNPSNEIINAPKSKEDFYTKDLTLSKKPIISISNGNEKRDLEINLESIPSHDGLYKMYCENPDGSRVYIPDARNPFKHATIRISDGR